jgi:hypothetical protein
MQPIETGKNNNQSCLNQVQKVRELFMLDCTAYLTLLYKLIYYPNKSYYPDNSGKGIGKTQHL